MNKCAGGFCSCCGNWIDAEERCSCVWVSGTHWGSGSADSASGIQEWAIRCMEDRRSLEDEHYFGQAA